jgi:carboxyl-terminal processing protease
LVELVPIIMCHSKIKKVALCVSAGLLAFSVIAALTATPPPARLKPGPNDGRIAYLTARLLEELHYSQQPFDAEISKKFFDGYVGGMEGLDPRHENFLQSDLAEFSHWRTNLDTLTVGSDGVADLTPAYEIFQRFLERFQQHSAYVADLLKQNKFKFTGDDQFPLDRRHAPYPKNLEAAKQLWRDRLRNEYLQEKLSREMSPTNGDVILTLTKSNLNEIAAMLARHYDWNLHKATNSDGTDVLQLYLNALAHAYDPHSDYLNTEHAQDFSIGMSLSLVGIGAQLTDDDGYCTINSLIHGGPADKSKLLNEKDRIVAVAQSNLPPVNVVDMEIGKVVQLIRGVKGTEVRLTISPADDRAARREVVLIRDEIKLEDQEAKAKLIELPDGYGGTNRLGIIDLPSFYQTIDLPGSSDHSAKSTTADVTKLVKKLEQEKVAGIVLDLRGNPGGSLDEAIKFTGLFIKDGPVVLAKNPRGHVTVDSDTDSSELYDGPLVVLINRFSASAAEIAAAALQDYGRALIVGDTSTHGKGTVQNVNPLQPFIESATNDPGTVKITIRKFYRVSGASTQLKGVASDIVLPDILNYSTEIGETSLENPLPWDTIPTDDIPEAKYTKLNLVEPYLARLRQDSDARIATNLDFSYIRQDIEQFKKLQADKSVTLNERDALKERQANQSRQKARDAERAARKIPAMKIYDLTVENADQHGLPMPESLTTTNYSATTNGVTFSVDSDFANHFGTNAAAKNSKPEIKTEVKTLPPDPTLNETENILEDYISLLSANRPLLANH